MVRSDLVVDPFPFLKDIIHNRDIPFIEIKELGLQSFFTIGDDEVRAWAVRRGALAPEAAGEVHTDMEKGFIRAEVISFDDLMDCGSMAEGRAKGKLRLEGKTYAVQDGDILSIRFSK